MLSRSLLYAVHMMNTESKPIFAKRRKLTYADPLSAKSQSSSSSNVLTVTSLNTLAVRKPKQRDEVTTGDIISQIIIGSSLASVIIAGVMFVVPWLITDAQDHNAKDKLSDIAFIEASNSGGSYLPLSELKGKENIAGDALDSKGVSIKLRKDPTHPDVAVGYTATVVSDSGKRFQINENHASFDDIKEVKK